MSYAPAEWWKENMTKNELEYYEKEKEAQNQKKSDLAKLNYDNFLKKNPSLVKLKSCYFNMSSYFLNKKTNQIISYDHTNSNVELVLGGVEMDIRKYNNLLSKKSA